MDQKSLSDERERYEEQVGFHRERLPQDLRDLWDRRIDDVDPSKYEPALIEALAHWHLAQLGCKAVSFEDPSTGGPDFCCSSEAGDRFYVEASCLTRQQVANITLLPAECSSMYEVKQVGNLSPKIRGIVTDKAPQCSQVPDGRSPTLLLIGSFHFYFNKVYKGRKEMLIRDVLISKPEKQIEFDEHGKFKEIHQVANFKDSSVVKPKDRNPARKSVSALVIAGFDGREADMLGALHPDAARPFDPKCLPGVSFASMEIDEAKQVARLSWTPPASPDV